MITTNRANALWLGEGLTSPESSESGYMVGGEGNWPGLL